MITAIKTNQRKTKQTSKQKRREAARSTKKA
jgi:hypothetical protein